MNTAEQPTCGKGLAENSVLPAKLADLLAAMSENLATHMKALDPADQNSIMEYRAYEDLVKRLQQIVGQLKSTADQMVGYRDLPMGRHDEKAMTHPSVHKAFATLVKHKQELLSLLEQTADRDKQLLDVMHAHSR